MAQDRNSDRPVADMASDARPQNGWKHFDLAERAARFGYWRTTLADNKTFWSPGMYRLLGVTPEQQAPDADWLLDQIQADDLANLRQAIREAVRTRSPFQYRTHSKDASANSLIVDTHGEVELGEDGRVVAVVGVCHDVTAQVIAESEREKAQERYRVMADGASDIIMLHENDRVVFASSALDRILKRTPEEIQDGRYLELVHPDDIAEAQKLRVRARPGETLTATYRAQHADGHYVWIEATTRAAYDSITGEFRHEISVSRDITERKEHELAIVAAQERAEAASKSKSLFLANMSHELRTPLNAIIGFTEVMRAEMFGPVNNSRYIEYLSLIGDSGKHLLNLIADVLDVAKIDAGKFELKLEQFDLRTSVTESAQLLSERALAGDIELSVDLPDYELELMADRRALKQIVLNLLSNAVKFTPPGGHVAVGALSIGGAIRLYVRDDGVGIPKEAQERLGRPFEQVCTDPRLAKGGAGLGLTLVRSLVEQHGGILQIESEEGVGTEVRAEFPLACPVRNVA